MLSRILYTQYASRFHGMALLAPRIAVQPQRIIVRGSGDMIPPTQYDIQFTKRLSSPSYLLTVYWETIPLFLTVLTSILILFVAIIWAVQNKVDVVFETHSRDNISRTMDLRNPSCHKMLTFFQRYDPWPEMQCVLDKMTLAEKRAATRRSCFNKPPGMAKYAQNSM